MSTAASVESRIARVDVTDDTITAHLVDGRVISVPLAWSWRLSEATPAQRANWELVGDGHGIHWPDVDEDISADGRHPGTSPTESYSCDRAGQQASAADEQREASPQVEVAFPCGSRLSADREISPGPAVQAAATRVEPEWQLD